MQFWQAHRLFGHLLEKYISFDGLRLSRYPSVDNTTFGEIPETNYCAFLMKIVVPPKWPSGNTFLPFLVYFLIYTKGRLEVLIRRNSCKRSSLYFRFGPFLEISIFLIKRLFKVIIIIASRSAAASTIQEMCGWREIWIVKLPLLVRH